jgi:hypothetical protein
MLSILRLSSQHTRFVSKSSEQDDVQRFVNSHPCDILQVSHLFLKISGAIYTMSLRQDQPLQDILH